MKALITGSEGFIGRHFREFLEGHGYNIACIDIKSGNDCRDFFKNDTTRFDLVIHCAAIVGGRETIEGDPLSVATDLSIDAEMFNWAVRTKQGKIVYFSSSAAYPIEKQVGEYRLKESDINLDDVKNPDFTYGWAKLTGEMLARYARTYGLSTYVFRPFSGYGSDQDPCYPFRAFIERAKRREDPFEVWGGDQVRDFIHVDDVVRAVMTFIEGDSCTVNLCTGVPTNFVDFAKLVGEVFEYSPKIQIRNDKPVGVSYRCGDPTLMHKVYVPKITLEEGIWRAKLES